MPNYKNHGLHCIKRLVGQILASALGVTFALAASPSRAQTVEDRFQDVFLTAGYCTAFGAALGTALLAWTEEPAENLKYVAIGASMGFIGGSILGTYVVVSPMLVQPTPQSPGERPTSVGSTIPQHGINDSVGGSSFVLRPAISLVDGRLLSLAGSYTILKF